MRLTWWQLAILVAVAAGFQVLLYGVAENGRRGLVLAEQDVRRAQIQLSRVMNIYQLVMDAESGHRGFLITGDAAYLEEAAAGLCQLHERPVSSGRTGELRTGDIERHTPGVLALLPGADEAV